MEHLALRNNFRVTKKFLIKRSLISYQHDTRWTSNQKSLPFLDTSRWLLQILFLIFFCSHFSVLVRSWFCFLFTIFFSHEAKSWEAEQYSWKEERPRSLLRKPRSEKFTQFDAPALRLWKLRLDWSRVDFSFSSVLIQVLTRSVYV